MKPTSLTVLCLSASLGAAAVAGCGGGSSDKKVELPAGVAAKIGGKTISTAAVMHQLDVVYAGNRQTAKTYGPPAYAGCIKSHRQLDPRGTDTDFKRQCVVEYNIQRAQAVSTLVQDVWLTEEVKRRGIDVSADVSKGLEATRAQLARSPAHHPEQKTSDLALTLRTSVEYDKLRAAMPASETEIRDYGNANGDIFLDSEQRRVHVLQALTKRESVRARNELEHGASWPKVMDEYGIKPFSAHWTGTHTARKATAPVDAFGRALFSQRVGKLTGPINTLNGWFLFEVLSIRAPKSTHLSPQAHDTVASTVRSHKLEKLLHDRYGSKTTCAKPYQIPEAPQCV